MIFSEEQCLPCVAPTNGICCSCFICQLCLILVDSGVVVGTSLSKYLLEKSRVVFQVRILSEVCCVLSTDVLKESMMLHLLEKQI